MFDGPRSTNLNDARPSVRLRRSAMRLAVLGAAVLSFGQSNLNVAHFSAIMPLGSDSILLQPAKQRLNMLLAVECPEFEKMVVKGNGRERSVTYEDGSPVRYYPKEIAFRFTIGSRTTSDEAEPNEFETKADPDRFQSNLRFRLKVFHGTEAKTYEPAELKMLGVPPDMPFDERIYHFAFRLKNVPVEDRIMLEILDQGGNRVGKFHLQIL